MAEEKREVSMSVEDTTREVAEKEAKAQDERRGFSIPTDLVPLPSKGLVYPQTSSLHGASEVEYRQMTAQDEDILTSRALIRTGKAMDMVLENCLSDKSIKADDLLAGDKSAITIALRVSSYGSEYNIPVVCPSCLEETKEYRFDLSKLEMVTLDLAPVKNGENYFIYTTPSGIEIGFKFLTSGDQRKISDEQETMKKKIGAVADKNITTRYKHQIVTVNGDGDSRTINEFSDKMLANDSRLFRKFIDDNEPDVKMEQMFECQYCGEKSLIDLPITPQFFWPE